MNRDRVKGTIDEMVGSAKQTAGKLTGDTPLQVKGMAQQVKGKLENTLGKAKDAVRETNQRTKSRKGARTKLRDSQLQGDPGCRAQSSSLPRGACRHGSQSEAHARTRRRCFFDLPGTGTVTSLSGYLYR